MEYSFPPPPTGHAFVLLARLVWVTFGLLSFVFLVYRVWKPKTTCATDYVWWFVIGIAGCGVAQAICGDDNAYDRNNWILPLSVRLVTIGTLVIAAAGACYTAFRAGKHSFVAIISVALFGCSLIVYLLAPAVDVGVVEPSRRTQCRNNLKQIGLAIHNYHDVFNIFPAAVSGKPDISWRVSILPYLDQAAIFTRYDQQKEWDRQPNDGLALERLRELRCPSNYNAKDSQGRWFTAYSMPTGPRTVGASSTGTTIKDITDGTSNTLLVVEACGSQIVWTDPRDVEVASQPTGINLKGSKPGQSAGWMSSYHWGGTQALLADGSVRFISAQTDPAVLKKLATVDGGEEVGDY